MSEENTPEGTGKRIGKEILSFVLYFVIVIAAMLLIIHYVGQRTEVSGSSMENTLSDGDNLIVDKISYRFHDPERYDIIIFPYKYEEDTYYIKGSSDCRANMCGLMIPEISISMEKY